MDKNKFKGMQMYKGFTQKDTANILGISEVSLSKKINQRDGADFKRKEIDKRTVKNIFDDILSAIETLHEINIVHRDITLYF